MANLPRNGSWRDDDLERGLAADLFNLSGLGIEDTQIGAYDMREVLNLVKEPSLLNNLNSADDSNVKVEGSPIKQFKENPVSESRYSLVLKAPTSTSKKLNEESITYLNQSQSYPVILKLWENYKQVVNVVVKIGFHERKLKVIEGEKFEEWLVNRPAERILEIDVPMSVGTHNIRSQGSYTNELEFEWDTSVEALVYVKINCVSSEFTKGKSGGESGVPLELEFVIQDTSSPNYATLYSAACQIKVFRPKGADRKLKTELSKYEQLSQEELEQYQPSSDVTILAEKLLESSEEMWSSPTSSFQNSISSTISSPTTFYSPVSPGSSPVTAPERVTQDSTIEETRVWLAQHRFHAVLPQLTNYTGADLLRLSKKDIILIAGNAEGIRLHNLIQSRVAKPILTIYICVESMQDSATMKEYQAVYLEMLTSQELMQKLCQKCNLQSNQVSAIFRQTSTGICILVNDEVVRNLSDEMSFIIDIVRDEQTNLFRLLLK